MPNDYHGNPIEVGQTVQRVRFVEHIFFQEHGTIFTVTACGRAGEQTIQIDTEAEENKWWSSPYFVIISPNSKLQKKQKSSGFKRFQKVMGHAFRY